MKNEIFLGQLSPGEIHIRERESQKQKDWGGGVTLAERLGFVMQFKPGDTAMLMDAYDTASAVRAQVEGSMEWGAYQVRVLEGPRQGESIVVNWAALVPIGPGFTENKEKPKETQAEGGQRMLAAAVRAGRSVPPAKLTEERAEGDLHGFTAKPGMVRTEPKNPQRFFKKPTKLGGKAEEFVRFKASDLAGVNEQRKAEGLALFQVKE